MHEETEQLNLNFGAPVIDGYACWQWEQQAALRRIAETWGLPLNQNVRLRLAGISGEFDGVLKLAEMPERIDRRTPLKLRMHQHVFDSTEIEACTVISN